jgi:hypothetical protein
MLHIPVTGAQHAKAEWLCDTCADLRIANQHIGEGIRDGTPHPFDVKRIAAIRAARVALDATFRGDEVMRDACVAAVQALADAEWKKAVSRSCEHAQIARLYENAVDTLGNLPVPAPVIASPMLRAYLALEGAIDALEPLSKDGAESLRSIADGWWERLSQGERDALNARGQAGADFTPGTTGG